MRLISFHSVHTAQFIVRARLVSTLLITLFITPAQAQTVLQDGIFMGFDGSPGSPEIEPSMGASDPESFDDLLGSYLFNNKDRTGTLHKKSGNGISGTNGYTVRSGTLMIYGGSFLGGNGGAGGRNGSGGNGGYGLLASGSDTIIHIYGGTFRGGEGGSSDFNSKTRSIGIVSGGYNVIGASFVRDKRNGYNPFYHPRRKDSFVGVPGTGIFARNGATVFVCADPGTFSFRNGIIRGTFDGVSFSFTASTDAGQGSRILAGVDSESEAAPPRIAHHLD